MTRLSLNTQLPVLLGDMHWKKEGAGAPNFWFFFFEIWKFRIKMNHIGRKFEANYYNFVNFSKFWILLKLILVAHPFPCLFCIFHIISWEGTYEKEKFSFQNINQSKHRLIALAIIFHSKALAYPPKTFHWRSSWCFLLCLVQRLKSKRDWGTVWWCCQQAFTMLLLNVVLDTKWAYYWLLFSNGPARVALPSWLTIAQVQQWHQRRLNACPRYGKSKWTSS